MIIALVLTSSLLRSSCFAAESMTTSPLKAVKKSIKLWNKNVSLSKIKNMQVTSRPTMRCRSQQLSINLQTLLSHRSDRIRLYFRALLSEYVDITCMYYVVLVELQNASKREQTQRFSSSPFKFCVGDKKWRLGERLEEGWEPPFERSFEQFLQAEMTTAS